MVAQCVHCRAARRGGVRVEFEIKLAEPLAEAAAFGAIWRPLRCALRCRSGWGGVQLGLCRPLALAARRERRKVRIKCMSVQRCIEGEQTRAPASVEHEARLCFVRCEPEAFQVDLNINNRKMVEEQVK